MQGQGYDRAGVHAREADTADRDGQTGLLPSLAIGEEADEPARGVWTPGKGQQQSAKRGDS